MSKTVEVGKMGKTKLQALMLRGIISQMSQEDQDSFKESEARLRALLEEAGDMGFIALSVVGAELVEDDE